MTYPSHNQDAAFMPPQLYPVQTQKRTGVDPLLTFFLVALAFTGGWFANGIVNGPPATARPYSANIWQAWNDIDKNYVDKSAINHQKMDYAMITAMVDTLGDTGHSRFLSPADVKAFNNQINNQGTVGIGVYTSQLTTDKGNVVSINVVFPDSPAFKAGLLPGDQFYSVNGTNVIGKTIDQVSPLIRGAADTTVTVVVFRPNDGQQHSYTITRAQVTPPLVTSLYFPTSHIGYVQILGFNSGVTVELTKQLKALQAQGMTSILLDLRDNPGGLVDEAQGVLGDFLPTNSTAFLQKDSNGAKTSVKVKSGLDLAIPIAILVNGGTASAAEITAGSIQDNRPGTQIIGQKTFGTDTVLIPFDLPDGSQLLLGVQQFLTPLGRQFKPGVGLDPTQPIALPTNATALTPLVLQELKLTEADVLSGKTTYNDTQLLAGIKTLQAAVTAKVAA